jgi:hypothetical protein
MKLALQPLLAVSAAKPARRLGLFALLALGVIESLANGVLSATDAVRLFFNAENCQFVRKELRDKTADRVMSHGVQLPDLFDALPQDEALREFQRELATMRELCLELLGKKALVA